MFLKLIIFSLVLMEISRLQNVEGEQQFQTFVYDKRTKTVINETTYECEEEGPMCEGCEKAVYCLMISDDVYIKYDVETCESGQTCSEDSGTCVPGNCDSNSETDTDYDCRMNGVFPDINDCSKYYICLEDEEDTSTTPVYEAHPFVCPSGYYFNSKRGICNLQTTDKCSVINVNCTPGQMGGIPNNPSIYYICLPGSNSTVLPKLFTCLNVREFDETLRQCVDNTPDTGLNDNGTCRNVGRFYYPSSCMHYNTCSYVGGAPVLNSCNSNYKFDPISQACVAFTCDDISC